MNGAILLLSRNEHNVHTESRRHSVSQSSNRQNNTFAEKIDLGYSISFSTFPMAMVLPVYQGQ